VRRKTIAVLGLTFKPNTDDMREAPSLSIITGLQDAGAKVRAYDPEGMDQAQKLLADVKYAPDPYACVEGADALVIVTEWDAFRALDLRRVKGLMRVPIVVDLRNIYMPDELCRHGFAYFGVGQPQEGGPRTAFWTRRTQEVRVNAAAPMPHFTAEVDTAPRHSDGKVAPIRIAKEG